MKNLLFGTALTLTLALAAIGCSNPADGTAAAEASEAKPVDSAPTEAATLALTDASRIDWIGSKVTGKHDGGFNGFTGSIEWAGSVEASKVIIDIDMNSIWSDNDSLTNHLKTDDFFSVETYPTARFESTSIAKTANGYDVTGNLEMKGVTKSITFPATIEHDGEAVTAQAEFNIMRFEWGIEYAGMQDDLIRDEVVIKFDLVAAPAA